MLRDSQSKRKDIAWLFTTPIAHRGLHDRSRQIPENSIPAFTDAIENGFSIELDIRRTSDNQIVAFHDSNLLRQTGSNRLIRSLTLQSLKDLRLNNTEHRIPLFEDILNIVAGRVPILIDIKNEEAAGAFEKKIYEIIRMYSGKFAIESFNPYTLRWFKNNAPHILRGRVAFDHDSIRFNFLRRYLVGRYLRESSGSPDFIAYDIRCRPYWAVQVYRRMGAVVIGWTAKNKKQMSTCLKHFDNMMFEGFIPDKPSP